MKQRYHRHYTSQHKKTKKLSYRQRYERVRVTRNGGEPIIPVPTQRFKHRPKHHFNLMTASDLAILDVLLRFRAKNWLVYPSQQTIANIAGVHRDTVSVALFKWERLGLLSNNYRHFKTSLYNIAGIFWDSNFIRKYRKWLPALLLLLKIIPTQSSNINKFYLNRKPFLTVLNTKRAYTDRGPAERLPFQTKNVKTFRIPDIAQQELPPLVCLNGENVMNEKKQAVENVTQNIRMSMDKKAWIACFPAPAIELAIEAFQGHLDRGNLIDNPFGWLYAQCKKICTRERVSPDHSIYQRLKTKYNFDGNCKKTNSTDILYKPKPIEKKPPKKESRKMACHHLFTGHKPFDPTKKGPNARDIQAYQKRMRNLANADRALRKNR